MKREELYYGYALLAHAGLGLLFFILPIITKVYALAILLLGVYWVVKTQNKNHQVLLFSAYIISAEIVLRMTGGSWINEYGKFSVVFFLLLGMFYSGFPKNALVYWIYIVLLIPAIVLSFFTLNLSTDVKKAIFFNITGPVCLGMAAIYCYNRSITLNRLLTTVSVMGLPLIILLVYVVLYNPSVRDVVTGTQSNFETSGGFGPNQVSTMLGLGTFIFFVQLVLQSPNRFWQLIHGGLMMLFAYRGLVTFSRGGMLTALVMIGVLLLILFYQAKGSIKPKIGMIIGLAFLAGLGVWTYSSLQTNGMLHKRYANQDAAGRVKKSKLSGREQLMEAELQMFIENPILGVGVGRNKEIRTLQTGVEAASHNEITRLLAEHGLFGLLALILLVVTPLIHWVDNRQHLLALSFFVFWGLTINHAAMRLAAPAFVYALSLLKITRETTALHRK